MFKNLTKKQLIVKAVLLSVVALLTAVLIALNVVASIYGNMITGFLSAGNTDFSNAAEALKGGDALVQQIEEESIVLLKNDNKALPLKSDVSKINLFGYGAYEGFLLKGIGSGSSSIVTSKQLTLLDALEGKHRTTEEDGNVTEWDEPNAKFVTYDYNKAIAGVYVNLDADNNVTLNNSGYPTAKTANYTGAVRGYLPQQKGGSAWNLAEPRIELFDSLWTEAKAYSDVAVFVISRVAGENVENSSGRQIECPDDYLDATAEEKAMLKKLSENFGTVVVILNTSNTMHLGFLDECGVDACLYVGLTGQSGARAIPEILKGTVNPSGKTTDIITKSKEMAAAYDPTYANRVSNVNSSIQYLEDIYYGYKWFETADEEGFFTNKDTSYDDVVQYPFGYGLSYTEFEWEFKEASYINSEGEKVEIADQKLDITDLASDTEISVIINVKNKGEDYSGKDVVQLYNNPPYTGNIEKASLNLLDFKKTLLLEPDGDNQDLQLTFTVYDLASYDVTANSGKGAYVLEAGKFNIKAMTDSHHAVETVLTLTTTKDVVIDEDPVTGEEVRNRFTGDSAYTGVPIDGSTAGMETKYLSREDFETTYPKAANKPTSSIVTIAANYTNTAYDEAASNASLTWEANNGIAFMTRSDGLPLNSNNLVGKDLPNGVERELNYTLISELAKDYNSDKWGEVLDQLKLSEVLNLIQAGGFRRESLESVSMPAMFDYDGPAGFNKGTIEGNFAGENKDGGSGWTAFTSQALMGCSWDETLMFSLGRSMGNEANVTDCDGWYAPGVNLHRTNYTARNFEYYSEDGVLSGKLAIQVIAGAKTNGLICYLKHLACSEAGPNPKAECVWLTEQNLRENYLKPFEIAAKGIDVELNVYNDDDTLNTEKSSTIHIGANAMMTAFNRIGASWAGANYAMNVEILRNEWGFNGALITDWTQGSDGKGNMNVNQGLVAGNDLWLNPTDSRGMVKASDSNYETEVYCARIAAHNLLYMFADTIETNQIVLNSGANLDSFQVSKSLSTNDTATWWVAVLIVIDVLGFLGLIIWVLFITGVAQMLIAKIKKTPATQAASADGGSSEISATLDETPVIETSAAPAEQPVNEEVPQAEEPQAQEHEEQAPVAEEKPKTTAKKSTSTKSGTTAKKTTGTKSSTTAKKTTKSDPKTED